MKHKLSATYESILIKLDDITLSQLGFSKYIWVWFVSLFCITKLYALLVLIKPFVKSCYNYQKYEYEYKYEYE